MALPDSAKLVPGTAVIWGEATATGLSLTVTNTMSLDALAAAAARAGAEADLGASFDDEYQVQLIIETGTAPTAGTTVRLYMVTSSDGTNYGGGATGADEAFTAANEPQLGEPVITLVMPNTGNTPIKSAPVRWRATGRYVVPVIVNGMNQAIRNETTNADNDSRVVLVPLTAQIQE